MNCSRKLPHQVDISIGELWCIHRTSLILIFLFSVSLAEQGKFPDAIAVLQLTSRAYPEAYLPLYIMAGGALAHGDVATARMLFQKVMALEPGHHLAASILAELPE